MNTFHPSLDGIDHINIYSKGKTELGRWLTNFARTPFDLGGDEGKFESIEGYWYWIQMTEAGVPDADRLRHLYGFKAKQVGRELLRTLVTWEELPLVDSHEFIFKIQTAMLVKLTSNMPMLHMLQESSLPFDHYYVFDGRRVSADRYRWQVDFWTDIRSALKRNALGTSVACVLNTTKE